MSVTDMTGFQGAYVKFNKIYFPIDAISKHEDFDAWYEDGDLAFSFKGDWQKESDKVAIFSRFGGQSGMIRPDARVLSYYLKLERYEHCLHTYKLFEDYYVQGMLWNVNGSLTKLPLDFTLDSENPVKEVHISKVRFKQHGDCYEIRVRDTAKLRAAVAAVVAIGIKEEYKGKSEGYVDPNAGILKKAKKLFKPRRTQTNVDSEQDDES